MQNELIINLKQTINSLNNKNNQLNESVIKLEGEKMYLEKLLGDMESALESAVKEREEGSKNAKELHDILIGLNQYRENMENEQENKICSTFEKEKNSKLSISFEY